MENLLEKVRIIMRTRGQKLFQGLTNDEEAIIEGMSRGNYWVTVDENGRLKSANRYEVPPPIQDDMMLPFWRKADPHQHSQLKLFPVKMPDHSYPSIIIQHLCGYGYTPEGYANEAKMLESYGFQCMRSRRDEDGKFWEIWFLPGLFSAKGGLRKAIGDDKDIEKAISFLCRNCNFGTLDIAWQKVAASIVD